ncbi:enoyl-CoA hydratase/isomerase family protein [Christensenellaceae bacterium OttesenSCG-928-K19]|nr:enoyl-CoA hydratase/isomerase family protein [Christensenellaceae bacterium OttesenSCG-928-K19]
MAQNAVDVKIVDRIAIVTMDDPDNPVNTWTEPISNGFLTAMDELEKLAGGKEIDGVVITSGKPENFHVGANLNKMGNKPETKEDKRKNIERNHSILNRVAALPVPVVVAINGHCMGGGMELALACTARVAQDKRTVKIGLPEFNVGLFPAGGGTQRLPRLIGYAGVDFIVDAKIVGAKEAYELGIVDEVVAESDDLVEAAKKLAKEIGDGSASLKREDYDFADLGERLAETKKRLLKKTRGRLLPAPKAFFTIIEQGLPGAIENGLELEKEYFAEVAMTPECKGYIHSFFLKGMTDKPAKMMAEGFVPKELKKTAVLGFGSMGRGIVICIIRDMGAPVVVKDTPEALEAGKAFVEKQLTRMYEKGRLKKAPEELMKLIIPVTEFDDNFKDVDIAIEAIYEDLDAKKALYEELCAVVSDDCLIASNTSGLSVDTLAAFVTHPERFGGMHFFSPVWIMQLVELVRGKETSQQTIDNFLNFAGLIRKRPLVCNDSPGFVVNAILAPFTRNGLKYIEEGNDINEVNNAFTQYGLPVGPVKLVDEMGIDVVYHIYKNRGEAQQTLENFYKDGRYGTKKNGKGFFLEDGSVDPAAVELIGNREPLARSAEEMTTDLLKDQITIAKKLLENGVVDRPEMVDIGMLYGTGYPQDKGGPLKWADLIGLSEQVFGEKFYQ